MRRIGVHIDQPTFQQEVELLLRSLARHTHGLANLWRCQRFASKSQRPEHLPPGAGQPKWGDQLITPIEQFAVETKHRKRQLSNSLSARVKC